MNPLFRFVESDNSTSEKVEGELKKVGELKKTRKLEAFRGREQS